MEHELDCVKNELDFVKSKAAPAWTSRMRNKKNSVRYPNEYVAVAIDLMAKANLDASKMPSVMRDTFNLWLDNPKENPNFATGRQFGRWREGISYLCLIHIGYLLTKHAKSATIVQDGTPDDGYHLEAYTIHIDDFVIKSLPWLQVCLFSRIYVLLTSHDFTHSPSRKTRDQ